MKSLKIKGENNHMFNLKKKIFCGLSSLFMLFTTSIPAFAKLPQEWNQMEKAINRCNKQLINKKYSEFSSKCSFLVVAAQEHPSYETYADASRASRILEIMSKMVNNPQAERKYSFDCLYYNAKAAYLKASEMIYTQNEEEEEEEEELAPESPEAWNNAKGAIEKALAQVDKCILPKNCGRSIAIKKELNDLLQNTISKIDASLNSEEEIDLFEDLA